MSTAQRLHESENADYVINYSWGLKEDEYVPVSGISPDPL